MRSSASLCPLCWTGQQGNSVSVAEPVTRRRHTLEDRVIEEGRGIGHNTEAILGQISCRRTFSIVSNLTFRIKDTKEDWAPDLDLVSYKLYLKKLSHPCPIKNSSEGWKFHRKITGMDFLIMTKYQVIIWKGHLPLCRSESKTGVSLSLAFPERCCPQPAALIFRYAANHSRSHRCANHDVRL